MYLFGGDIIRPVLLQSEKLCFYVYFYACLHFSWTSILSTFITVRMFRSVKTYAGVCCFFMSVVSGLSAYLQIGTLSTFFSRSGYFVAEN